MTAFADVVTTPCETNPDLFFKPEGEGRFGNRGFGWSPEPAKALCRGCEVREACLTRAIERDEEAGVWGGMTREERNAEKKRRALARKTTGAAT